MTRVTRGRASKVDLLPQSLQDELHKLLRDKSITQMEALEAINDLIEEHGLDDDAKLSRSGLNRYAAQMETVGRRIQDARDFAKQWLEEHGTEAESNVSDITLEMLRSLVFDLTMKLTGDKEIDPKDLRNLTMSMARLENAAATSQKRVIEARKQFAQDAANEIETIGKAEGLTNETVQLFKNKILGIA